MSIATLLSLRSAVLFQHWCAVYFFLVCSVVFSSFFNFTKYLTRSRRLLGCMNFSLCCAETCVDIFARIGNENSSLSSIYHSHRCTNRHPCLDAPTKIPQLTVTAKDGFKKKELGDAKKRNTVVLGIAEQVNIKQCFKSARFCMSCIYMCDNGRMRDRERKEGKTQFISSFHSHPFRFIDC